MVLLISDKKYTENLNAFYVLFCFRSSKWNRNVGLRELEVVNYSFDCAFNHGQMQGKWSSSSSKRKRQLKQKLQIYSTMFIQINKAMTNICHSTLIFSLQNFTHAQSHILRVIFFSLEKENWNQRKNSEDWYSIRIPILYACNRRYLISQSMQVQNNALKWKSSSNRFATTDSVFHHSRSKSPFYR